jgi:hypothetical protein
MANLNYIFQNSTMSKEGVSPDPADLELRRIQDLALRYIIESGVTPREFNRMSLH